MVWRAAAGRGLQRTWRGRQPTDGLEATSAPTEQREAAATAISASVAACTGGHVDHCRPRCSVGWCTVEQGGSMYR